MREFARNLQKTVDDVYNLLLREDRPMKRLELEKHIQGDVGYAILRLVKSGYVRIREDGTGVELVG